MKRNTLTALFALAVMALVLFPGVGAAQEAAFKAELTPYGWTLVPGGEVQEVITDCSGLGTHLGWCLAQADVFEDIRPDPWVLWGTMVLTAADGDLLNLDFEATFTGPTWAGTYKITGGTGRFEGAGGSGDLDIIINYTSPPTWCFDGTITF